MYNLYFNIFYVLFISQYWAKKKTLNAQWSKHIATDPRRVGRGVFKFLKMLNIPTRNQSVLIFKFTPPMRNWLKGGGGKVMRGSNVVEGRGLVTFDSNLKINQWRFSPYLLAYNESFAVIYTCISYKILQLNYCYTREFPIMSSICMDMDQLFVLHCLKFKVFNYLTLLGGENEFKMTRNEKS